MNNPKYRQAEQYRENKQYAQAALVYAEIWTNQPNAYIGSRYVECLRKSDQVAEAEEVARDAVNRFPDNAYVVKQLAWALQAQEKYLEAAQWFGKLWDVGPDDFIASSYVNCLRKAHRLDDAENVAQQGLRNHPDNQDLARQLGWVIYDKRLKPAKEEGNLNAALSAAQEIIALHPDDLGLSRTVLVVMNVAKRASKPKWRVVLQWADKVDAQTLDKEPREYGGRRIMSDRETYFLGRAKALLNTRQYEAAYLQTEEALHDFPRSFLLARLCALAQAKMGDVKNAADRMRALQKHPRFEWYAKAELADMEYQLGNYQEAYSIICSALASTRQGAEYKPKHLVTLARIAVALDLPHVAAAHIHLARVVRSNRDWNVPDDLVQVENTISAIFDEQDLPRTKWPDDEGKLTQICQNYWREASTSEVERKQGIILPNRHTGDRFTFIKLIDGTGNIYVRERNLGGYREGTRVDFAIVESYDKLKDRKSVEAVDLRLVR